jgi:hypothetical protein
MAGAVNLMSETEIKYTRVHVINVRVRPMFRVFLCTEPAYSTA